MQKKVFKMNQKDARIAEELTKLNATDKEAMK
jgi:hypothetical protein